MTTTLALHRMSGVFRIGTMSIHDAPKMIAMEPVWVPHDLVDGKPVKVIEEARKGRAPMEGPNGEPADHGKWRLKFPIEYGGAVWMGETISASALDTASDCIPKWGWDRCDNIERPDNRKADLGQGRHTELEDWSQRGVAPKTEGMSKVLAHFPMPGRAESETYFGLWWNTGEGVGVVFAGYLDARESIVDPRTGLLREPEWEPEWVADQDGIVGTTLVQMPRPLNSVVRDLKTTGSYRYKKTPAQLRANIQAALYGLGEMLRIERAVLRGGGTLLEARNASDGVILKWTYALLKELKPSADANSPDACKITRVETVTDNPNVEADQENIGGAGVLLTREEALATVATYVPLAVRLIKLIETKKKTQELLALDVEQGGIRKNADACQMYGGCGWKKNGVCEPPASGGFKAWLKAEKVKKLVAAGMTESDAREKVGVASGPEALVQIESATSGTTRTQHTHNTSATGQKKMGLAARFGNKATAGNETKTPETKAPEKAQPPVATSAPKAPATGGLGARFAKPTGGPVATTGATTTAAVSKVDQKAVVDGASSTQKSTDVKPTSVAVAEGGPTLLQRLQQVAAATSGGASAGASAGAIESAVANAPVVAVGINPPDAAKEWTPEEQAAEAARLAGIGADKADKAAKKAETSAQAAAVARAPSPGALAEANGTNGTNGTKAKKGAKKAAAEAVDQMATNAEAGAQVVSNAAAVMSSTTMSGVRGAVITLDTITMSLMQSGERAAAAITMDASAKLAALQPA